MHFVTHVCQVCIVMGNCRFLGSFGLDDADADRGTGGHAAKRTWAVGQYGTALIAVPITKPAQKFSDLKRSSRRIDIAGPGHGLAGPHADQPEDDQNYMGE